jgi:hypothetical protein
VIAGLALMTLDARFASAQSPVCGQIRAEIAQLGRGSGNAGQAARLRSELGRIRVAMQQNQCGRTGFLGFSTAPPVCGPLRAQAGQYEAQLRQIGGGGDDGRRAQLVAALDRYGCNGQPQRGVIYAGPNPPSLFDRLFGDDRPRGEVDEDGPRRGEGEDGEPRERLGGRMAVCVRTCDGFFFPVNFEGLRARDEYDEVCHALCPAAETRVFFMPGGADIERAAARDGTPYMSLPMAKQYTVQRDPTCACKQPGQTWASAMQGVEDIVEARKGDIVVTKEQALAMSRPKEAVVPGAKTTARSKLEAAKAEAAKAAAEKAEAARADVLPKVHDSEKPVPESELPTGGTASSGIGTQVIIDRTIAATAGVRQQVIDPDGSRRTVRNVAPELSAKERGIDLRGEARP